jgi:CRISPR/Cas system Type II protein with McrA/HNH and RuvC-like nuclease domain
MGKSTAGISSTTRIAIYLRDECRCAYCGKTVKIGAHNSDVDAASLDHVQAHSRNGSDDPQNIVTCCASCNSKKSSIPLARWYRRLSAQGHNLAAIRARVARRRLSWKRHIRAARALIAAA